MLAAEQLLGGAGHSPLVQEQGQMVATFTVAYRW
jgi:outer membrane scaffolding protein for murein synthesis (MipA/OmpV family)